MLTVKCDFCGVVKHQDSGDMYVMKIAPRSNITDVDFYDICDVCLHKLVIKAEIIRKAFQLEDCKFNEEDEDDE